MPKIFKGILGGASDYVFKPAAELKVEDPQPPRPQGQKADGAQAEPEPDPFLGVLTEPEEAPEPETPPEPTPETDPIYFAKIQANAIRVDAKE